MEMAEVEQVRKKFQQYGMRLYTDYSSREGEHCFMVDNMIIYLDKNDNSIAVSFLASAKPEEVATNMMVLNEIEDLSEIFVMESFVYDINDKFISGEEAHTLVRETIKHDILKDYVKRQAYLDILTKAKCFEC